MLTDFHRDEAKKIKKTFQNGGLKKTEIFNSPNSQFFFKKIFKIGPWVSRVD
jgi:hypothetical protein